MSAMRVASARHQADATGHHARWVRPPEGAEDPERVAIREAWPSARPSMINVAPWASASLA
jgi:hypothetical protein